METVKNILYLAIFSTVVVAVWIVLTLIHNHDTSTITQDIASQIVPLNPNFDTDTINTLSNRTFISVDLSKKSPLSSSSAFQKNLETLNKALKTPGSSTSGGGL